MDRWRLPLGPNAWAGGLRWGIQSRRREAKLKVYLSNSLSRSACRWAVLCVFTKCQNLDELLKKKRQKEREHVEEGESMTFGLRQTSNCQQLLSLSLPAIMVAFWKQGSCLWRVESNTDMKTHTHTHTRREAPRHLSRNCFRIPNTSYWLNTLLWTKKNQTNKNIKNKVLD